MSPDCLRLGFQQEYERYHDVAGVPWQPVGPEEEPEDGIGRRVGPRAAAQCHLKCGEGEGDRHSADCTAQDRSTRPGATHRPSSVLGAAMTAKLEQATCRGGQGSAEAQKGCLTEETRPATTSPQTWNKGHGTRGWHQAEA